MYTLTLCMRIEILRTLYCTSVRRKNNAATVYPGYMLSCVRSLHKLNASGQGLYGVLQTCSAGTGTRAKPQLCSDSCPRTALSLVFVHRNSAPKPMFLGLDAALYKPRSLVRGIA
jgi:hypothetical protein